MPSVFMLGTLSGFAVFEVWWTFVIADRLGLLVGLLLVAKGWPAWKEIISGKI